MRTEIEGLTLGEISYALAEITEIKLEIEKSQACAEIRNQYTVGRFSVKSRVNVCTNSDIFAIRRLPIT